MKTLYERLKENGIEMSNHESDLYCPATEETTRIIGADRVRSDAKVFRDQITRKIWYEIPFAYDPYWASLKGKEEDLQ